jgi:hypothetical protein
MKFSKGRGIWNKIVPTGGHNPLMTNFGQKLNEIQCAD